MPARTQHVISRVTDKVNGLGSYSAVHPGDTVYFETGTRDQLIIENINGTAQQPIVFAPQSRQNPVVIKTSGTYGISIRNCSYIRLTGVYRYGIQIIELGQGDNSVGISIQDKSTDVEIDHVEIANTGFVGILAKTDPVCGDPGTQRGGFIQKNTVIHHCYIHDTYGEGLYIGNTFWHGMDLSCGKVYPMVLEGVEVYNNKIERTGWDGIQVSSAIANCRIYNNELNDVSYRMTPSQMSGILIGGGTRAECYNNRIKDAYATGILVFGQGGTRVFNNVIIRPALRYEPEDQTLREYGIYILDKSEEDKSFYGIYSNTIIQPKSDAIRISDDQDFEVRLYNNLMVDPGAREVYINDNTERSGIDAYIFIGNFDTPISSSNNAMLPDLGRVLFSSAATDNYHLQAGSSLVDTGRDLSDQVGVNFDLDNNPRPLRGGWDIGAYEYNSTGILVPEIDRSAPVTQWYLSGFPHNRQLTVEMTESVDFMVRIVGVNGAEIFRKSMAAYGQGINHIPVSVSESGLYIVQIIGSNWQISEKLLVN